MKNQAAVLVENEKIEILNTGMPEVGDDDVLVEAKHVGLCGSDITYFQDYTYGGARPDNKLPIYLGHEVAGIVVETGKNVRKLKAGDKVALEPSVPCMKCSYCREGRYNLCDHMDMMSAPPFHRFALQRYISHPEANTFALPEHMDTIEGALLEPLNVGMYAAKRGEVSLGNSVLVLGAGTIGIMTLLACRAYGADNLIAVDIFDNRLETAKELIPEVKTINSMKTDMVEELYRLNQGKKADIVFETAGNPKTLAASVSAARKGGCIVTVGNVHGQTDFPFLQANFNEIDIRTQFRYRNLFPAAIKAVAGGRINVKPVVSDIFAFEDTQKAFRKAIDDKSHVLKVMVKM